MSTNPNIYMFSTREDHSNRDILKLSHAKNIIVNAAHKLAYMKMIKEQVKNTPSLSADDAKTEILDFCNSKIRELEDSVLEERRQRMMAEARSKLLISFTREELDNLLIDVRGEPRYSCTLRYCYGAGKTPMRDYKSFISSKEVCNFISRLVESYPGVYPKGRYILPTVSFLDEMFGIATSASLDINKEKGGCIPSFEFTSRVINY